MERIPLVVSIGMRRRSLSRRRLYFITGGVVVAVAVGIEFIPAADQLAAAAPGIQQVIGIVNTARWPALLLTTAAGGTSTHWLSARGTRLLLSVLLGTTAIGGSRPFGLEHNDAPVQLLLPGKARRWRRRPEKNVSIDPWRKERTLRHL